MPTIIFGTILFGVTFIVGYNLGDIHSNDEFSLNCDKHLYPRAWIELYSFDLATGIFSLCMMGLYTYTLDVTDEEHRVEFDHLKNMV